MAKLAGDVLKLPKWAQAYIEDLLREREMAIRTLNEFQDSQTPSRIYYEDHACTGEETGPTAKIKYIQSNRITFLVGKHEIDIYSNIDEPDHPYLEIYSDCGKRLFFSPQSGNVIRIEEPRR